MLSGFEYYVSKNPLICSVISIMAVALMATNSHFQLSPFIGVFGFSLYLVVSGIFWEKAFFGEDDPLSVRVAFGVLITVVLIALGGVFLLAGYKLDESTTPVLLASVSVLGYVAFKIGKLDISDHIQIRGLASFRVSKSNMLCLPYLSLAFYCLYLILVSRRDMASSVFDALPSMFTAVYFVATLLLLATVLYKGLSVNVKIPLIALHTFLTLIMPFAYSLAPMGDPWSHLGKSRTIYITGHIVEYPHLGSWWAIRPPIFGLYILLRDKVMNVLTVVFTRMIGVDLFWVHITLIPALWGLFTPFIAYKISHAAVGKESIAVLSALLSLAWYSLITWGAWPTPNSLAFFFGFFQIVCLIYFLKLKRKRYAVLAFIATLVVALTHLQVGALSFSFLILAYVLVYGQHAKLKYVFGPIFLACVFVLPLALCLRSFVYVIGTSAYFSLLPLSELSFNEALWKVVFGWYSSMTNFRQIFLSLLVLSLGVLGFAQSYLQKGRRNLRLVTFLFALVVIVELDHRLLDSFMANVPFGTGRILKISYFILTIFTAVPIYFLYDKFSSIFRSHARKRLEHVSVPSLPLGKLFLVLSMGCLITVNVVESYSSSIWTGTQPTNFELDVVKFVHKNADGKPYIVLAKDWFSRIGGAYVGYSNFKARYFVYPQTHYTVQNQILSALENSQTSRASELLEGLISYYGAFYAYFVVESHVGTMMKYLGEPLDIFKSEYFTFYVFRLQKTSEILERASMLLNPDFEEWTDSMPSYWDIGYDSGEVVLEREASIVYNGTSAVYGKCTSTGKTVAILGIKQAVYDMPQNLSFSFYLINHTYPAGRLHVMIQDVDDADNIIVFAFSSTNIGYGDIGQGSGFRRYRKSVIVQFQRWYAIEWNIRDDWMKVYPYEPNSITVHLMWLVGGYVEDTYVEAIFDAISIKR